MRQIPFAILIILTASAARAQYASPNKAWTGYHLKAGDTSRLERHVSLSLNNGQGMPGLSEFDERHTITVDSVDKDGNLFIVDVIRSNSIVKTYSAAGTVTDQTDESNGWHRTLVFAKISKTGKFLGGNQYIREAITALGDSVSIPSFRNTVRTMPVLGRATLANALPVLGSNGLRTVGSSWIDTILFDVLQQRYDMSVTPSGTQKPVVTTVWVKDTEIYQYDVLTEEERRGSKCLKVRSVRVDSRPGAAYTVTTETTMWLDERSGMPVEQEVHSVGKNASNPNAGGTQDSHIILVK